MSKQFGFSESQTFFQATSPKPPMLPPGASGQPIQQDQQQWKPPGIQGQPGISQGRQTLFFPLNLLGCKVLEIRSHEKKSSAEVKYTK